ncbi:MAG: hypothetical protein IT561_14985 [Alphaproteobacteria bacterium]|nr:hypothetical protein [Alphaproteobacteria bacterium]
MKPPGTPMEQEAVRALRAGRIVDAARAALRAIDAGGESALALWVLARSRRLAGDQDAALGLLRRATALDPTHLPAMQDLGATLMGAGDAEGALVAFRAAVALAPERFALRSAMLVAMHYCASVTAAEIAAAHRDVGRLVPVRTRPARRRRAPGEPLRIGFVSADFRGHSTAAFLPPLLRACDRERWRVTLYSGVAVPDAATSRFRALADDWVDAAFLGDDALAARIVADGIDVLVDLNGHTAGNRLGTFARRPAPLQLTWLDYVHSTGLAAIDFLVTDVDHVHAGEDDLHVETVLRLAPGTFCFDPPERPPAAARPPGPFTFGSFNALEKLSDDALRAWAEILQAVPWARLRLGAVALDRAHGRERVTRTLAACGIAPDRYELLGATDRAGALARHGGVDLHLDSFPYSGGLTTLEGLWMGTPTLTFRGDRIAGRHSASHLRRIGLPALVARDRDDYVAAAVALARTPARLDDVRGSLRARVAGSSLVDGAAQARGFADLVDGALAHPRAHR